MLEALLGGALKFGTDLINQSAANKRYKQMMQHLREVENWQKSNLAQGLATLQSGRQEYLADPGRAKTKASWDALLENPSSLTDEAVSATKASALSSNAKNFAEGSRRLKANAQRSGIGNSGYVSALDNALFSTTSRDAGNLSARIDLDAAKTRQADKERVLKGYSDWNSGELDRAYQFDRDITNTLAGVQYGNSLAMTG